MPDLIERLNQTLADYGVKVRFSKSVKQDFNSYGKGEKINILSMLTLQAKKGPLTPDTARRAFPTFATGATPCLKP